MSEVQEAEMNCVYVKQRKPMMRALAHTCKASRVCISREPATSSV
jgi:hypothetical protein